MKGNGGSIDLGEKGGRGDCDWDTMYIKNKNKTNELKIVKD